ncbi:hypothetical protein ACN08X_02890 [Rothia sp. P6271]|uniref:hypothetical protein n=1 Tax=Rothia sp. P6271 TaxID=3402659 RepID=UPI003AC81034
MIPLLKHPQLSSCLPRGKYRIWSFVIALIGFFWLLTPRLQGVYIDHLHKEDGSIFLSESLKNGGDLFNVYTGYLHVYPRGIANICSLNNPEYFSHCTALSVAAIRVALFFLLLMLLNPYVKNVWWAIAAAALVIFGGSGQQEVLGNITNLRWFLDVGATAALLGSFTTIPGILLALFLMIGGALSDPLTIALLPIALWRLIVLPARAKIVPLVFFPIILIHIMLLEPHARTSVILDLLSAPITFLNALVVRGMTVPLTGESAAQLSVLLVGAFLTSLATVTIFVYTVWTCYKQAPLPTKIMSFLLFSAGILFLTATMNFATLDIISVNNGVAKASRYSLIASIFVPASILILLSWAEEGLYQKISKIVFCGLLVVGSLVDSRGDEWSTRGPSWSETVQEVRKECANAKLETVKVPITPQGVPKEWSATLTCKWVTSY